MNYTKQGRELGIEQDRKDTKEGGNKDTRRTQGRKTGDIEGRRVKDGFLDNSIGNEA